MKDGATNQYGFIIRHRNCGTPIWTFNGTGLTYEQVHEIADEMQSLLYHVDGVSVAHTINPTTITGFNFQCFDSEWDEQTAKDFADVGSVTATLPVLLRRIGIWERNVETHQINLTEYLGAHPSYEGLLNAIRFGTVDPA